MLYLLQTAEAHLHQTDTQLGQQMRTNQELNTQVREKDERLRRTEEEFRVEVQRKETQLRQKDGEIRTKDADISRLQRELQVCL